jgi:MFS family permease
VSLVGVGLIGSGIACYASLGVDSDYLSVGMVLALLGFGIGIFTPANQKLAFASVAKEEYGVLAAMLSSFGTAAGTIGTTIAVALMEMQSGPKLWLSREAFAEAQQIAFLCLTPIGIIAVVLGLVQSFRGKQAKAL